MTGSEVEHVAVWIGLVGTVASIVLATVAIIFTVLVNGRTERLNDQTIKSLQSIESDVDLVKETIRDLVKGAWESRVVNLAGAGSGAVAVDAVPVKELASGLAAEQVEREEPAEADHEKNEALYEQLSSSIESALERQRSSLDAALQRVGTPRVDRVRSAIDAVESLSDDARELYRTILEAGRPLTPEQYDAIQNSEIGDALRELRTAQLILPLRGREVEGGRLLVYNMPSSRRRLGKAIIELMPRVDSAVAAKVRESLRAAHYPRRNSGDGRD